MTDQVIEEIRRLRQARLTRDRAPLRIRVTKKAAVKTSTKKGRQP
jgi:hypothetical protein